jgi:hypothetical protein
LLGHDLYVTTYPVEFAQRPEMIEHELANRQVSR